MSIASLFSCTRATPAAAYYTEADGTLTTFAADTLRYGTNGLLVEEARTNGALRSQEFDNGVVWGPTEMTVTANAGTAPDGTATADLCLPTAASSDHKLRSNNINDDDDALTAKTFSIYAKPAGYTKFALRESSATGKIVSFLLTGSGSVLDNGVGFTPTIVALANGWYRITGTITADLSSVELYICAPAYTSGNPEGVTWTGDGTSGIYFWGLQLEVGAFATSYIPTTTASVTRAADFVDANSIAWWGVSSGSVYVQASGSLSAPGIVFAASNQGAQTDIRIHSGGGAGEFVVFDAGFSSQADITNGVWSAGSFAKAAFAYQVNNFAFSTGGAAAGTDVSGSVPSINRIVIRDAFDNVPTTYIKRIAHWSGVRLSNGALQTLTDPDTAYAWALDADATASLDLDLTSGRAWDGSKEVTAASLLTCSRASEGYAEDTAGVLHLFGANELRQTTKGLLVEEERTNVVVQSNFAEAGSWSAGGNTTVFNFAAAPDGTNVAVKFIGENASESAWRASLSLSNSTTYAISVYAKYIDIPWLYIRNIAANSDVATDPTAWFNLQTGELGTKGPLVTSYGIEALGDGWYRCWTVSETEASIANNLVDIGQSAADNSLAPGSTGLSMLTCYSQIEQADFVTSYIPTTTVAVTRAADDITAAISAVHNPAAGSYVVNYTLVGSSTAPRGQIQAYGDDSNYIALFESGTQERNLVIVGAVVQVNQGGGTTAFDTPVKVGLAYAPDDVEHYFNGASLSTDTSAALPTVSILRVGLRTTDYQNGYTHRITYWRVRLPDATMNSLTT